MPARQGRPSVAVSCPQAVLTFFETRSLGSLALGLASTAGALCGLCLLRCVCPSRCGWAAGFCWSAWQGAGWLAVPWGVWTGDRACALLALHCCSPHQHSLHVTHSGKDLPH